MGEAEEVFEVEREDAVPSGGGVGGVGLAPVAAGVVDEDVEFCCSLWLVVRSIKDDVQCRKMMDLLPSRFSNSFTTFTNPSSLYRSAAMNPARPPFPNALSSLQACSHAAASREAMYTRAPLAAKPSEIMRPMPLAPPVTRTTLSYGGIVLAGVKQGGLGWR